MIRFIFVLVGAFVIAGSSILHYYGYAMITGIAMGAMFFVAGVSKGGLIGKPRAFGGSKQDVNARIGIALAASGIAAGAQTHNPPYPEPFLIFYLCCVGAGCLIALSLSYRSIKDI
jgi:peptidoglycan/LPS O-acetylase OafA/YrhL